MQTVLHILHKWKSTERLRINKKSLAKRLVCKCVSRIVDLQKFNLNCHTLAKLSLNFTGSVASTTVNTMATIRNIALISNANLLSEAASTGAKYCDHQSPIYVNCLLSWDVSRDLVVIVTVRMTTIFITYQLIYWHNFLQLAFYS